MMLIWQATLRSIHLVHHYEFQKMMSVLSYTCATTIGYTTLSRLADPLTYLSARSFCR
jgi:hypothetical protein